MWCSIIEQTTSAAAVLLGYYPRRPHYSPRCSSSCTSRYNRACLSSSDLPLLHHQTNLPRLLPINFQVCSMTANTVCRCNGGGGEGGLPILRGRGHCCHPSRGWRGLFLPTTVVGGMTTMAISLVGFSIHLFPTWCDKQSCQARMRPSNRGRWFHV